MSAFHYAKMQGIHIEQLDKCQDEIDAYMRRAVDDDRRLMWLTEQAAEHTMKDIQALDVRIICAREFQPDECGVLEAQRRRLVEDFRFTYALHTLLKAGHIDNATTKVAAAFKLAMTPVKKKKG